MSDIHGEYEAFLHIRKSASGAVRQKVDLLFGKTVTSKERCELATLIYYPKEKLNELRDNIADLKDWYYVTITRLLEVCRLVSCKYTRSKVRKLLKNTTNGYDYIINELLNKDHYEEAKASYYENILKKIVDMGASERFIVALCNGIKTLVVDHLHIVGDIFDRGPRADIIVDELLKERSIDIQWGNHDVLWMGAAAGSRACIATVINNSITYKNLDVIEIGYGISLRPLSLFANETYSKTNVSNYMPKGSNEGDFLKHEDDNLIARMHKAIAVIQFKIEGQCIKRNPEFEMEQRLLLHQIDYDKGTVCIDGKNYPLKDCDFPTIDPENPYAMTEREAEVMKYLKNAFMRSEKLQRHIRFLYEKGEMYTVFNNNLMFHGCIPLCENGEFMALKVAGGRKGKELMDYCDKTARQGYYAKEGTEARQKGKDFLWYLWCGKDSPLCARKKITSFERLFIEDKSTWEEPKNTYYECWNNGGITDMILSEFGLGGEGSHIINGHIPVRINKGENPVKAGGKLIVIDGGFCKAYQPTTGIAGYTLIYNSEGIRISAHEPFKGVHDAITNNADIISDVSIFEHAADRIRVRDTDIGKELMERIEDLSVLLREYEEGNIKETGF
jgi:fructose-1,6-bisphosphatase-3